MLGGLIKIVLVFLAVLVFLITPFAEAATMTRLDVVVLAPDMEQTIDARLNEEFSLNGKIRQRALIAERWGEYENLVVELSAVKDGTEGPEADLRINALKNGVPLTLSISDMCEGTGKNVFGVDLELKRFVNEGDEWVGAIFVAHSQSMWSKIFSEIARKMIFGF